MNAARISSYTGLIYSLPIVLWASSQLFATDNILSASVNHIVSVAVQILIIAQLIAVILFVPFHRYDSKPTNGYIATLLLVITPLPFFSIAALTGAIVLSKIVMAQLIIAIFALLYFVGVLFLARVIPKQIVAERLIIVVQLASATTFWITKDIWLVWLEVV